MWRSVGAMLLVAVVLCVGCDRSESKGGKNHAGADVNTDSDALVKRPPLKLTALAAPPAELRGEWGIDAEALAKEFTEGADAEMKAMAEKMGAGVAKMYAKARCNVDSTVIKMTGLPEEWHFDAKSWHGAPEGIVVAKGTIHMRVQGQPETSAPADIYFQPRGKGWLFGMGGEEGPPNLKEEPMVLVRLGGK